MTDEITLTLGSDNIFTDLGFSEEESAALSIKSCLFRRLQDALSESALTQTELADKLGVKQPHISGILNGKMSGFSMERIAKYLLRLDYNIYLVASPAPQGTKGGKVLALNSSKKVRKSKKS